MLSSEIKEGRQNLYEVKVDKQKLEEYREDVAKKYNLKDCFYQLELFDMSIIKKIREGQNISLDEMGKFTRLSHCENLNSEELINQYVVGNIPRRSRLFRIFNICGNDQKEFVHNFLIMDDDLKRVYRSEVGFCYLFDKIIELPSELAALQLLEEERYSDLVDDFNLFSKDVYSIYDLEYVGSCIYDVTDNKTISDQNKVLKKIQESRAIRSKNN